MRRILAALALAACPFTSLAHPLQTVDVLCGGVAAEERQHLAREVRGATVQLEFYVGTQGQHVRDVDVLFSPIDAPVAAFGIVTEGPVCLVQLPAGRYRVYTWFNGHARSTEAVIRKGAAQPIRITLGFPADRGSDPFLVPVAQDK